MTGLAVLMPVYQNQEGLERSLGSLREANGNFDVVIVDDGSPTPIHVPWSSGESISLCLLRLENNLGIAAALNHGIRHILAHGYQYIARLDAGDTVVCDRFEQQAQMLSRIPSCALVGSHIEFVDETQESLFCCYAPCGHKNIIRSLHLNNCLIHSGTMFRALVFKDVGLYSEDFCGAEDYELFFRIAKRHTLAVIPKILTRCEYGLGGLSIAGRRAQQWTRLRLQFRYFDPYCLSSYYGLARTLLAMLVPHGVVLRLKLASAKGLIRRKHCPDLAP